MYDAKTNPRGRRPAAFFLAILLALSLSLAPAWAAEGEKQVIPLGRAVGIKLFSSGVLVVDLSAVTGESGEKSPAKSCGLKEGDVIVSAAGSELRSTEQLQELLEQVWYVTVQAMKPAALRPAEESCAEAARAMRKALGQKRLAQLAQLLRRYAGECRFNVGVGHVLGALAASCEQIFPPVR